ncbi:hypothetical protein DRE_05117 [Drechslerella stenobrocha 248]|uniref:WSC domain-containing protein n=1 Tax=Drechslerella stenobrocha 248 TaxID=1043628 RepID=W7I9R5_9PEZI|nr:hypothetical protein DRE_05117 [Drechslerella stenobrocha 248]
MQAVSRSIVLSLVLLHFAVAQSSSSISAPALSTPTLHINAGSDGYRYLGCYNETLDITNDRAIYGGNVTRTKDMTVGKCLAACKAMSSTYEYAGLEYTNECWCGPYLSELSEKLNDSRCDLGCVSNNSEACGGSLTVSVYKLQTNGSAPGFRSGAALTIALFASLVSLGILAL